MSGRNKALPPKEFIVATLLPSCINEFLSEGKSVYSSAQSLLKDQNQESEGCLSVSEWRQLTINRQSQEKDKTKLLSMELYEKICTKSFLCDSINNYGLVDGNYALLIDEICSFLNLLQDNIDSYFHCQNVEEDDEKSRVVEKKSFCLDMTVVRQKQSESIRVDKLLGDVFEEDEPSLCESPDYPESPKLLHDMPLDSNHFQLLHLISQRKLWHRTELESKANDLGLLLDGALETINDVAFDFFDEAATDGEDPIEVDIEIVEPLLDQMKSSY
ncbi:MAG: tellurite resistance TerB C-terminal domain-containing protein [Cyanobacteria bacterium P01_D01_bin.1]